MFQIASHRFASSLLVMLAMVVVAGCQSSSVTDPSGAGASVAASAKPGPGGPSADQPLDLLAIIDPARDQVHGEFRLEDGALVVPSQQPSMLELPVEPPEAYLLTLTVRRTAGTGSLNLKLSVDGQQTMLVLDGWNPPRSGLSLLDNQPGNFNRTTYLHPVLNKDEEVQLFCKVHPGDILVKANGKPIIDWRGDPSRLSLPSSAPPGRMSNRLTLGSWDASFHITACSLKSLSGEPIKVAFPGATGPVAANVPQPMADDGWQSFESVGHAFILRFPQLPQRTRIEGGGDLFSVTTNTGEYSIAVFQALRGSRNAAEYAEEVIQELLSSGEKIQRTRPLKLAGSEYGKEVVITDEDNDLVIFRFYLTRENLYQVMYIGPPDRAESVETKRFLDSFQIRQ